MAPGLSFHYTYSRSTRPPAQLFRPSHNRPRGRSNQNVKRIKCCKNSTSQITISHQHSRRTANYPPTIWDNSYIQALSSEDHMEDEEAIEIGKFKEEVTKALTISSSEEVLDQIEHIDTLQQLGVAYHFQEGIKNILAILFCSVKKTNLLITIQNDIHATALLFRLLRENGFHVSTNIFNNFREEGGSFNACLKNDIKGMLSLYEASFLAVEGENELDEARLFATESLRQYWMRESSTSSSDPSLRERITHAMELPLHWRLPRLHARWFIDRYEKDHDNMNPTLLRLAKLDFNFVQNIYKRELKELSRWWTNLGLLRGKLGFSRDRLVENYLWTVAVGESFEPNFWQSREAMTKANCLTTTIDDIYDVYGTFDELEHFTDIVDRWDVNVIEQLPDYMKTCFLALFNTTNDTAYKILNFHGINIIPQLKKVWADLCKAYLVEAKWYHNGYIPTLEEYLDNGWITISGPVVLAHAFCTSEDITYEALQCYNQLSPNLAFHSSMIARLINDLATSTAEIERGDVPKAIQCYMIENGVLEEIARENIREMIVSTWKKLNGDLIVCSSDVESFKSVRLNFPRMAQCIYQYGDGFGDSRQRTKDQIISLLIEPISL